MRAFHLRLIAVVTVLAFALVPVASVASAQAKPSPTPKPGSIGALTSAAAVLVNLSEDDQILFTRAARAHRAPASLTKIVTALVARDLYSLDEVVSASPLVLQTGGSDLGLEPGIKLTVRDMLYALLLPSTNDTAMGLAAHDPLGYEHFISLMNQKARALGAYDSQFKNPHGLDQVGHYSSARDLAIFARALLRDPVLAQIVSTKHHSIPWRNGTHKILTNHNKLLFSNPSIFGVKTGFTAQSGHCLISAEHTQVGTLLAVVMGSRDHYADTNILFNYGKAVSLRTESGGGAPAGYGRLPVPPSAPSEIFASAPLTSHSDPRDDTRWSILMMTLAILSALTMIATRKRVATASGVQTWLAKLQAEEQRRRR